MPSVASKKIGSTPAISQKTSTPKKPVPAKQAKPPGGGPNPNPSNVNSSMPKKSRPPKPKQPNLPQSNPSQPSSAISKTQSTGNPKTNLTSAKPHTSPKANSSIAPKSNGQHLPKSKALATNYQVTHQSVTVFPKKPVQENSQGKTLIISAKPNQQRTGMNKPTFTKTTVVTTKVIKWTKTNTIISNGQQTITSVSEGTRSTQTEKQSISNCPGLTNLSGIKKPNKTR
ncbi:hypothetical protein CROQUDRAFT_661096 [Cronartium quercuum f. sp. fusiforme G11]|uniref:Uncharacterized protein n=1 Tax=Cronartium quercuum f. sp. fusiforme G11 TaxID=708437 RepID=A0A9P6NBH7_9BASI|nr:hypothetical protein CROQUDRAFT_661096 [Cronartium quercuum f. sp. fusiforme G11]